MTHRARDLGVVLLGAAMLASVGVALARSAAPAPAAPPPAAALDIAPILRLAPFGRARPVPVAATGFELRGILLARPLAASTALIAATGGPTAAYAVGDALPGGAVLDAVEYDLVVLRRDGRIETLAFPTTRPPASERPVAAAAQQPAAAAVNQLPVDVANSDPRDVIDDTTQ